jgi:hypothetical protein
MLIIDYQTQLLTLQETLQRLKLKLIRVEQDLNLKFTLKMKQV